MIATLRTLLDTARNDLKRLDEAYPPQQDKPGAAGVKTSLRERISKLEDAIRSLTKG